MKLPNHIKEKIKKVVEYERLKKLTMQEITEWKPELKKPVMALEEGWDWEMYFYGSPKIVNEKEIEAVILSALTGKLFEVRYNEKTITLKEMREKDAI